MGEVTATEAARTFADLLDAVEHRHQAFTIVRRGRAVARLQPVSEGKGADVKQLLRRHDPDRRWARDLAEVRSLLELGERA
jgi:prevent-host-death family protein